MNLTSLVRDFAFAKWVGVLKDPESGKATEQLFSAERTNFACCLGHACRALDPDCISLDGDYGYVADGAGQVLPLHLADLLGISQKGDFREPVPYDGTFFLSLAELNDFSDIQPADIADVIVSQYKLGNFTGG